MNRKIVKNYCIKLKNKLKGLYSDETLIYSIFNRIITDSYIKINNLEVITPFLEKQIPELFDVPVFEYFCDYSGIDFFDLCFQYYNFDKDDYLKKTQFYTPQKLAKNFCIENITENTKTILEPCCGSGVFLREIYDYCCLKNFNPEIIAFEIDKRAIQLSKVSFTLNAFQKTGEFISTEVQNRDFLLNDIGKKFDLIISNPPYSGRKLMPQKYMHYLKDNYPLAIENIAYGFLNKSLSMLNKNGVISFIMPENFMYLKNTNQLNDYIKRNYKVSVKQISNKEFKDIYGSKLLPCSINIKNMKSIKQTEKSVKITYLENIAEIVTGIQTGNNKKYLKHFSEIDESEKAKSITQKRKKWYPYLKGGGYKKWSGNDDFYIFFENNGEALRKDKKAIIRNERYFNKEGITYSYYCENRFSARYKEKGTLFDIGGSCLFFNNQDDLFYTLALLNSSVGYYLLNNLNPTMSFQTSTLKKLPLIIKEKLKVISLTKKVLKLSKQSDVFFDNSKFFKAPDIIKYKGNSFEEDFIESEKKYLSIKNKIKITEQKLNTIFENIYNLKDIEFYEPKQITQKQLRKNFLKIFFNWLKAESYEDLYKYLKDIYPNSYEKDVLFIAKILNGKKFKNPKMVILKELLN